MMELGGPTRRKRSSLSTLFLLIVFGGLVFGGILTFRTGDPPIVEIASGLPAIGPRTSITVKAREPKRGLTSLTVTFVQGERREKLAERTYEPQAPWATWEPKTDDDVIKLEVGRETLSGLKEGDATIEVTAGAAGTWLRTPEPVTETLVLPVKIRPPTLLEKSIHVFVTQGGCEAVVYDVGPSSVKDGVKAGRWFFPGFPLPKGKPNERFAIFAVPYDFESAEGVKLHAEDDVGNFVELSFIDKFTPKPMSTDTIRISDGFLKKVVPAIMAQTPALEDQGGPLENYLQINRVLRKQNRARLVDLAAKSKPAFLWKKAFFQMNAQVMSTFADSRTYTFNGKDIDHQVHLGYDLASVRNAPIPAANSGVVALAEYYGIYGNAVVLDHGYGLMTLYSHLSSIDVEAGQTVTRGQSVGKTGATGLAGGDHLHFTTLLAGLPVNAMEWWDSHWVHDRLKLKLGDAFDFES